MRILFDHGTPAPLRRALTGHSVSTVFDALITTDRNLPYQQNLTGQQLAILVLPTTSWPKIHGREAQVVAAVNALRPGDVVQLNFS